MGTRAHAVEHHTDSKGNALSGSSVYVYQQGTTTPIVETIYQYDSDHASQATTLSNPLTTDSSGMVEFFLASAKRVDLKFVKSGYTTVTRTVDVTKTPNDGAAGAISGLREAGTDKTQRGYINFLAGFDLADDAGNNETEVSLDLSESPGYAGTSDIADIAATESAGAATTIARGDHVHALPNDLVTYAKMQNVSAASRLLGRGSASGAGDPEEISIGSGLSMSGTTLSGSGKGYTLQAGFNSSTNPSDATTYYIGFPTVQAPAASGGTLRIHIPAAGTVTAVYLTFRVAGTLGSNETSTISFRLNDTTDTTISSSVALDAITKVFSNTGLSIAVATGDFFELKWVTPTWATNPTTVVMHAVVYVT